MRLPIKVKHLRIAFYIIIIYAMFSYWLYRVIKYVEHNYLEKEYYIYDIDTPNCKIIHIGQFSREFRIFKHRFLPCNAQTPPDKCIISNDTHIYVNGNFSKNFTDHNVKLNCSYQVFKRRNPESQFDSDLDVIFSKKIHYFNDSVRIKDEFVKVVCTANETRVCEDYHAFVPLRKVNPTNKNDEKSYRSEPSTFETPEEKLNPIIIGIDAISRTFLYHFLPKTVNYILHNLEAIEYLGFQKVGVNTYPIIIPMFTGNSDKELQQNSGQLLNFMGKFDNTSLIWEDYHNKGYSTLFAEESPWMGLFNYNYSGFLKQPTTHYYGPFSHLIEARLGHGFHRNTHLCIGKRAAVLYLLEYALKFLRTYHQAKVNFFATFWETSITHDMYFYPEFDKTMKTFFEDVNSIGVLNNSILFIMSDHGVWGVEKPSDFWIDARTPFLYVVIPKWFRQKYQRATKNLMINSKRITSTFDLHETLKTFLNGKYTTPQNYKIKNKKQRGISLFEEIPNDRTCEDAGIPEKFCKCNVKPDVKIDSQVAVNAAVFAIQIINKIVSVNKNCSRLALDKVLEAENASGQRKLVNSFVYKVVFRTHPGGRIFSSTVNCKNCIDDFNIIGPIIRLTLFDGRNNCVDQDDILNLKLFCYCESNILNKIGLN